MLNLATILEESTRCYPNQTAIVFNDVRLSYAQLNSAANQVAQGLKNIGLERGDHVALSCLNLPYFPIVYYGILKVGGTVVPLNVLLKRQEVTYHLDDSDAKVYFCFQGTEQLPMGEEGFAGFNEAEGCEHFVMITADPAQASPIEGTQTLGQFMKDQTPTFDMGQTQPEDTAVILYTSGTTGRAKGAELSHFNMFYNAIISQDLKAITPEDVELTTLPLFHSFGQTVQMNASILKIDLTGRA